MRNLTYKDALNEALFQAMRIDQDVFVLGEDVGVYGGGFGATAGLLDEFGEERVIDTPISENGFCGMAIGSAIMGLKPVCELMFADFLSLGFDPIVNTGAKLKFTYGDSYKDKKITAVFRGASGAGTSASAQHSQSVESWFMGVSGINIISPSNAYDAKGLLLSAINSDGITIFLEPKALYNSSCHVPEESYYLPIGKADLKRQGSDLSIITYGRMTSLALELSLELEGLGISAEVLDLCSLKPLDEEAILKTAQKTGRVLLLSDAPKTGSVLSEVSAIISEKAFSFLKAPIKRLAGKDTPVPYSKPLENAYIPSKDEILRQCLELVK